MKTSKLAVGFVLLLQVSLASAEPAPKCFGSALELCECSALFSVLEVEATTAGRHRMREWRALAKTLRISSYPVMGEALGNQLIDAKIAEWRALPSTVDTHREFSLLLSRCARFWDGSLTHLAVSIGP
jgi:hypothetical protein